MTAERLFTEALRFAEEGSELRATLLSNRGLSKLKLGQPTSAVEDFASAIKVAGTPNHWTPA